MPSGNFIYTFEQWPNAAASNNLTCRYDCGAGTFRTDLHVPPFTGQVVSTDPAQRTQGAWDGSFWYVVGPDSKLYRYNPVTDTWSAALAGGGAIMSGGTPEDHNYTMASDGRNIWIYDIAANSSAAATFRRYDPVADNLTTLSPIPGGVTHHGACMWLLYDGGDRLYGQAGDATGAVYYYSISGGSWTATAAVPAGYATAVNNNLSVAWGEFLLGKLFALVFNGNTNAVTAFSYNPSGNSWSTLATTNPGAVLAACSPFGPLDDDRVIIFGKDLSSGAQLYDAGANTWATGENSPFSFSGTGQNFAVARKFAPMFTWYAADGTTPLVGSPSEGQVAVGGVITVHVVLKSASDRAAGVTVSVPNDLSTDAEAAVLISATLGGSYTTSFSTAAITAGQAIDVFVKITPNSGQSLGNNKTFNLLPTGN